MAYQQDAALTLSEDREEELTPAAVWYSLTGSSISDEFLDWPLDMFALTEVILKRSEVYRFVLSPPDGVDWPPSRIPDWSNAVEEAGQQWSLWVENRKAAFPDLVTEEWLAFRERLEMPLEDLASGHDWRICEALLTLHAIADEACAGIGAALDGTGRKGCIYRARGRELLATTGSLARIRRQFLRVLPKLRTPPAGTSWRSFSRYACVNDRTVDARWHKIPIRRVGTLERDMRTCCSCPGHCACESPTSDHSEARCAGQRRNLSASLSLSLQKSWIWTL